MPAVYLYQISAPYLTSPCIVSHTRTPYPSNDEQNEVVCGAYEDTYPLPVASTETVTRQAFHLLPIHHSPPSPSVHLIVIAICIYSLSQRSDPELMTYQCIIRVCKYVCEPKIQIPTYLPSEKTSDVAGITVRILTNTQA